MVQALIFDCDGVLADTERYGHLPAFNATFEQFGLRSAGGRQPAGEPVRWSDEEYRELVSIGGGKERMATLLSDDFTATNLLPTDADGRRDTLASWHAYKTARYKELVMGGALPGRPGIRRLVTEAHAVGWKLAVASTSAEPSVRAVLEYAVGPELAAEFGVYAGDIVSAKKPAPDIYLAALDGLGVDASEAVAVEDSGIGLRSALAAGLTTLVTASTYTGDDDFTGAALVVDSLGDLPATPARVLQGTAPAGFTGEVTLADLVALAAR